LQSLPSSNLKGSPDETNGKIEFGSFPIEILIELPGGFGKRLNRLLFICDWQWRAIPFPPKM
jgi:hypothetical protein